jgi:hypothetical protein
MINTGWLDQFSAGDVSPLERAMLESARQDRREAIESERREAEREAARERRLESMAFAERQLGNPMAELSRARAALAEGADEVSDLRSRLEKAERRHAQARSNLEFWAQRAQQATDVVQRSAPSGGVEGAVARAQEELRAEASRRKVEAMLAQRSARRAITRPASPPKAAGGQCGCGVPGCTAYPGDEWVIEPVNGSSRADYGGYQPGREIVRYTGPGTIVGVR